ADRPVREAAAGLPLSRSHRQFSSTNMEKRPRTWFGAAFLMSGLGGAAAAARDCRSPVCRSTIAGCRLPVAGGPNASFTATCTYRTAHTPQPVVQADAHSSKGPPVDMCDPP